MLTALKEFVNLDSMKNKMVFLATVGRVGYLPKAPGTWGTLASLILFIGFRELVPTTSYLFISLVFIFSLLSIYITTRAEKLLNKKDPTEIVLDEVVGFFVACIALPQDFLWLLAAFILFRLADIFKPFPARWIQDHCKGGLGIVGDDIVAGLYTCVVLQLVNLLL